MPETPGGWAPARERCGAGALAASLRVSDRSASGLRLADVQPELGECPLMVRVRE